MRTRFKISDARHDNMCERGWRDMRRREKRRWNEMRPDEMRTKLGYQMEISSEKTRWDKISFIQIKIRLTIKIRLD